MLFPNNPEFLSSIVIVETITVFPTTVMETSLVPLVNVHLFGLSLSFVKSVIDSSSKVRFVTLKPS